MSGISGIRIKSTSEEKAEEITKKHMHSESFNHMLNVKIENEAEVRLRIVQSDLNSTARNFEDAVETVQRLEIENQSLRQQIKVIAEHIASLDTSESEGKETLLVKKEH
ncbi:hypothetical protein ACSTDZ_18635 [Vibrio vulnificus]|uniref:hypothetical protein n=1 Tax=Vibrio vulnificus TaxID=672 RepID=UPI003EDA465C